MPEVRNKSIEQAAAELEETLRPQTDYPKPTDVNAAFADSEAAAIAEFEKADREDRKNATKF